MIKIDLETFFENQDEMKQYCSEIASKHCIRTKIRNNCNYYKIYCNEPNCQFQITYNYRNSKKSKSGYYLVCKGTCLDHQFECPNSIANVSQTKDSKYIAKQILPLFNERTPSLNDIKSAISCFNEEQFTTSELKYI